MAIPIHNNPYPADPPKGGKSASTDHAAFDAALLNQAEALLRDLEITKVPF
jgi:hypothetical protein